MQIFLHKNPLPHGHARKLAEAGIIAIQTDDFSSVKMLDAAPAMIHANDLTWALLDAVETGGYSDTTGAKFIANLCKLAADARGISPAPQPKK